MRYIVVGVWLFISVAWFALNVYFFWPFKSDAWFVASLPLGIGLLFLLGALLTKASPKDPPSHLPY